MKKKIIEKMSSTLSEHFDKLNKISITAIDDEHKKQLIDDIRKDLDYDKNNLSDIDLLNIAIAPYRWGLIRDLNKEAFEILASDVDIPPYYKIPKINCTFMADAAKYGYYYKVESLIKNHICSPKDINNAICYVKKAKERATTGGDGAWKIYNDILELIKGSYNFDDDGVILNRR